MMHLPISVIVSFIAVFLLTPKFIIFLQRAGLVGTDVHKKEKPKIPEMGGPVILIGFLAGAFLYMWSRVFLLGGLPQLIEIFAAITTILIITLLGIFDDISRLLKLSVIKDEFGNVKRIGIKRWQKPLLTIPAAVPLMAIMAGNSQMVVPLLGPVDFGIFYPLIIVPLAIVGASNATNMLAGLNGLEASLGVILLASLGGFAYLSGELNAAMLAFLLAASLLAFLFYNRYPSKIFGGDSLTYMIGAAAATVAVIGNIEKFAALIFLLWFAELALKLRRINSAQNFGILQDDGTLKAPYERPYSLTHVVMNLGRFKEQEIVLILVLAQIVITLVMFSLVYYSIL